MRRRPPRSTRTDTLFPYRRSSDLADRHRCQPRTLPMLIPCPHCGPRDVGEFTYGGDATKERPDPGSAIAADWCDYVFYRDNPRGRHIEHWHHGQGCRLWLKRSEEHTSELQSLMRISYAVFCLKKKNR